MSSTRSIDMDQVVHMIWKFILKHDNWVTATHIPGIFNEEADLESRKHETRTEWMINWKYFEKIIKSLNFKPTVDLFSTTCFLWETCHFMLHHAIPFTKGLA